MQQLFIKATATILAALLIGGCATSARQLMPTPTLYQLPGGQPVFDLPEGAQESPDLDLLFITDRAPPTPAELEAHAKEKDAGPLPYGQERARGITYGSARVRVVPALDWEALREQSRLSERTREVNLELGQVQELGAFPREPYRISKGAGGKLLRDREELALHFETKAELQGEIRSRLTAVPKKEILLYVHGFNETFATVGRVDLVSYQGELTDAFGHSYFTTNPQVSSDLIELIRYGKQLGEPGRELIKTGSVSWKFPIDGTNGQ